MINKKKPKKIKRSAISRALVKSSKESAKRGARSSALIKKKLKKRLRTGFGIGASRRKEPKGFQGAITNKGKSAIRGGSAALAAFIAARYSPKAIAKYQDYAGRLRRSKRLIAQIVDIDANTFRIRKHIVKTSTDGLTPYSCTCPDFSQFSDDARTWLGSKAGPFNPCKHMMAVRDRGGGAGGGWNCSDGVCTFNAGGGTYATKAQCEASLRTPPFLGGQCLSRYGATVYFTVLGPKTVPCAVPFFDMYGPILDLYTRQIGAAVACFFLAYNSLGVQSEFFVTSWNESIPNQLDYGVIFVCSGLNNCGNPAKRCAL